MSAFLKIVSGVYLIFVWLFFAVLVVMPPLPGMSPNERPLYLIIAFVMCVTFSIPAVALFAFGQVVGDVRAMRSHLAAMRRYYEPQRIEPR